MWNLALKNILYYKGRSITTFMLTFISAMLFIVYVALMEGSHKSMLENSLKVYQTPIQIYTKGYRDEGGVDYLIYDVEYVTRHLKLIPQIASFTPRFETYGLLSNKEYSSAAMMVGIYPDREAKVTILEKSLIKGRYLTHSDTNGIYMGKELALRLELDIGQSVAFIGSDVEGGFASDIFKVVGIFKTGLFEFDSSAIFINKPYLDTLLYCENIASYIAINVDNLQDVKSINHAISQDLNSTYESLSYFTLMKDMIDMLKVDSIFGYISIGLFFVVIFFVIMIYGFVNVSTRIKEFGLLGAIGLSSAQIRLLLFYEIFIISTVAIVLATPIGAYISYYYSVHPIVIEGISETYKDYGIVSDEMPLSFNLFTIFWNVMVVYILNLLSILYPMRYLSSFRPVEALGHV
ncbi:MAG: ABC transporter permease [Campylobacterales bacterium]|nr:ABC transporter permease [Campylobacterales bacterium]